MKGLTLKSYAKINLYLAVLNRRKDGCHNINTIFERIDLFDTIALKLRKDKAIRIISRSADIPKDSRNIAWRSAKLLQDDFNPPCGADIKIVKRIPVGAGLGGGSSNAAAVLAGLNKLWALNLSRKQLLGYAKKLGADVPFFLYDTAFAQGEKLGNKITPLRQLEGVRLWHILIVPKLMVSTPLIYEKWDLEPQKVRLTKARSDVRILISALEKRDISLLAKVLYNSLNRVTVKLYPQTLRPLKRLSFLGVKARLMSGSGPAVFGVTSSRSEALNLHRELRSKNRLWRIFITATDTQR